MERLSAHAFVDEPPAKRPCNTAIDVEELIETANSVLSDSDLDATSSRLSCLSVQSSEEGVDTGDTGDTGDATAKPELVRGTAFVAPELKQPTPSLARNGSSTETVKYPLPAPTPDLVRNGSSAEWTESEDELIVQTVSSLGCKWRKISALLPGRSDDAVRNRWAKLLRERPDLEVPPDVKCKPKKVSAPAKPRAEDEPHRQCWSREEDQLILLSVADVGSKWALIAALMSNRTEHGVRNRYNRLMMLQAQAKAQA